MFWDRHLAKVLWSLCAVAVAAWLLFSGHDWTPERPLSRTPSSFQEQRPKADQPTAVCADGTYSYSSTRQGTCSWHGGVATWLR